MVPGSAPSPPRAGNESTATPVIGPDPVHTPYETALASGEVPFTLLAQVYYFRRDPPLGAGEAMLPVFHKYYPLMVNAFEDKHGRIRESYFAAGALAAGAITDRDEIYLGFPLSATEDGVVEQLLFDAERLGHEIVRLLDGSDRRRVSARLFSLCTYLLAHLAEASKLSAARREREQAMLRSEMEQVRRALWEAAQRAAQIEYFKGMLLSVVLIVSAVGIAGIVEEVVGLPMVRPSRILTVVLMGAVGAGISVMYRMSFRRLVLDILAGRQQLFRLGMVRPAIGATLALAVYFLLESQSSGSSSRSRRSNDCIFWRRCRSWPGSPNDGLRTCSWSRKDG